MSREAFRRLLALHCAIAVLYGVFHMLATPREANEGWAAIIRDVLGWALLPLLVGGFLPTLAWAMPDYKPEKARATLLVGSLLAVLVASAVTAAGFYEGTMAVSAVPANVTALFSNDYSNFIRVVRSGCTENLRQHPISGISRQQASAFCSCYAERLASGLSSDELRVAITSKSAMTPQLRSRLLDAAPICREKVFGRH